MERRAGGQIYYALPELIRDRAPRRSVRAGLTKQAPDWWPPQGEADEHDKAAEETEVEPSFAPDQGRVQQLLDALTSDESTLADDAPQQLRELAGEVDPHDADLASNLRQLADIEGAESPDVQVNQQLWQRMPRFVRFDNRARQLDSEYDINAADASPGTALSNLSSSPSRT